MGETRKHKTICLTLLIFLVWVMILSICLPDSQTSQSERRRLQLFPDLTFEQVRDGTWMRTLEDYWVDQFPARDFLRSLSAGMRLHLLRQKDDHGVYLENGHLAEMERPLNESSLDHAAKMMKQLVQESFARQRIACAIIPDKHYFLATAHGSPSIDQKQLIGYMRSRLPGWNVIDLADSLTLDDYYRTDIHWRQESLHTVAEVLLSALGRSNIDWQAYTRQILEPFNGSYASRTALTAKADQLIYLTHPTLDAATVFDVEKEKTYPLYLPDQFDSIDGYSVFLGGASPLQVLNNPAGSGHLLIFRDSFASSLAPLLLMQYETITLVDLRYMTASHLMEMIDTESVDDVLFLYSTRILNNSYLLRE